MERQITLRGPAKREESGRKPDFIGAGFAAWIETKDGKDYVWLKDERTGQGVYLNEVRQD